MNTPAGEREGKNSGKDQRHAPAPESKSGRPGTTPLSLRLWPAYVIVVTQWLLRFILPAIIPEAILIGMLAGVVGGVSLLIWWLFLSRAPGKDRLATLPLMIIAMFAGWKLTDPSIAKGMMGMMFFFYALPLWSLGLVIWVSLAQHQKDFTRLVSLALATAVSCGFLALFRSNGIDAAAGADFAWRWSRTAEERYVAQSAEVTQGLPTQSAWATSDSMQPAAWPGFRGSDRDGIVTGSRIASDWTQTPPKELWRRPIGPAWSSFAVLDDFFFTQEQRGEEEVVACYRVSTGEPVWHHADELRFWEANAGAGPRGTPTLHNGWVLALGATGQLNVLQANDGTVVWSRNTAADTGMKTPIWGFSSSPLVYQDLVIIASSGKLAAYKLDSGAPVWFGPDGGESYSSPHFWQTEGTDQILLLAAQGIVGVTPKDGTILWQHDWPGFPIIQPAITADGDLLITAKDRSGIRRLHVAQQENSWQVKEIWTSTQIKPYFNDFVVHKGKAFGFDGGILACMDVETGARQWKGGRYGHGQLVLLAGQDLILVLAEQGDLALVNAHLDQYTELARIPALQGKTWNHPVLVNDTILLRNDREMAAFRLPLAPVSAKTGQQHNKFSPKL